jgi:hypothetical protein
MGDTGETRNYSLPGPAVKRSSRYALLFSSIFSTPMGANRFPIQNATMRRDTTDQIRLEKIESRSKERKKEKMVPIVPVDSSAAKIPFPGTAMAAAVWASSALNLAGAAQNVAMISLKRESR